MKTLTLILIILISCKITTQAQISTEADLTFQKQIIDVYFSKTDTIIKGVFTFQNNGKKEIKILKSDKSCNCTSVELSKKNLKPGEKGIATLYVDLRKKDQNSSTFTIYGVLIADTPQKYYKVILKCHKK